MSGAARRALAIGVLSALGALVLFDVLPWRCPVAWAFGVPCPTCGLTRAARLALHGAIGASLAMFPAGPLAALAIAPTVALETITFVRTGAFGPYRLRGALHAAVLAAAVVMFAVWLARFFGAFGGPVAV